MDQKDIRINNLEAMLSEALVDSELDKLVEETSVDIPDGVDAKKELKDNAKEANADVDTNDVIDTVKSAEDVDSDEAEDIDEEQLKEDTSIDEVEGVKLPEGVLTRKPQEVTVDVDTDTVINTVKSAEDVDSDDAEDIDEEKLTEDTSIDEVDGVKLPEGVLTRKPEDGNADVNNDTVIDTVDSAEDIDSEDAEDIDEEELKEETSVDEVDGVKLPEGVLTRKPEDGNPDVDTNDVIDTVKSAEDVDSDDAEDIDEEKLTEDTSIDEVDGVKLPEGVLTRKPQEANADVDNDTVINTIDHAKDVDSKDAEGIDEENLEEAIATLNRFIDSINENADVNTEDVINTVKSGEDVEGQPNSDKAADKTPENREFKAACAGKATGVESLCHYGLNKKKEYKSLKEAIVLGEEFFQDEEKKQALTEEVAILMASENDDLLYKELASCESKAQALREAIEHKYSIVSGNRVEDLLESMADVQAKVDAHKNNMFKKLNEQQEINAAVQSAKTLTAEEIAFRK